MHDDLLKQGTLMVVVMMVYMTTLLGGETEKEMGIVNR